MNLNEIPKEIVNSICSCPPDCRSKILKAILSSYQTPTADRIQIIQKFSEEFNVPEEKITEILGAYFEIVRIFIACSNDKEFNAILLELGFPSEFIEQLPLTSNRAKVVSVISNSQKNIYNKLIAMKWRFDVSLSSSRLMKKMPIIVIMTLQLSNGQKYTITMDVKTFHKLRFNIACVLKSLTDLKNNQILQKLPL